MLSKAQGKVYDSNLRQEVITQFKIAEKTVLLKYDFTEVLPSQSSCLPGLGKMTLYSHIHRNGDQEP